MSSAIHIIIYRNIFDTVKYCVLEPREVGSAHNVRQTKKSRHDKLYMRIVDGKKNAKNTGTLCTHPAKARFLNITTPCSRSVDSEPLHGCVLNM